MFAVLSPVAVSYDLRYLFDLELVDFREHYHHFEEGLERKAGITLQHCAEA